jgi:hypothetical protein
MEPIQNDKQDQNNPVSMAIQKTNEDFNKKQPDPKDPNEIKATHDPEVPDFGVERKENPDDIRMNNENSKENVETNPEFIDEDETDEVGDNGNDVEKRNAEPVF